MLRNILILGFTSEHSRESLEGVGRGVVENSKKEAHKIKFFFIPSTGSFLALNIFL